MSEESLPLPAPEEPSSAIDTVFEKLIADIVSGTYPPGARLPAERDLARLLGASRPTLREALRRLSEWNLIAARRGSGIVVRDYRDWMIEVLPAYLRYAKPGPDHPRIAQLIADLLQLRRSLMVATVELVAERLPAGGTAEARKLVREAWDRRDRGADFAHADLAVLRAVVDAAGFLPSVWTVNRMAGIYADLARSLGNVLAPPDDYVDTYDRALDALEAQDAAAAATILGDYLTRHDRRMLSLLELIA